MIGHSGGTRKEALRVIGSARVRSIEKRGWRFA